MRISDWSSDVCSSDLVRAAERSLDIHLTGNMERFMWSFDGIQMSDYHEPIPFIEGERVRINLINDSMMSHPIHLHGHFFELVTGQGDRSPRKPKIGRASCRERVCQSVLVCVLAVSLNKKTL